MSTDIKKPNPDGIQRLRDNFAEFHRIRLAAISACHQAFPLGCQFENPSKPGQTVEVFEHCKEDARVKVREAGTKKPGFWLQAIQITGKGQETLL